MAEKGGRIDWEAIHGLMEDAIYGGRIDNAQDVRVLRSYLSMFFNDGLVGEKAAGAEILKGTPLRIPNNTEYDSFIKIINQVCIFIILFVYCYCQWYKMLNYYDIHLLLLLDISQIIIHIFLIIILLLHRCLILTVRISSDCQKTLSAVYNEPCLQLS